MFAQYKNTLQQMHKIMTSYKLKPHIWFVPDNIYLLKISVILKEILHKTPAILVNKYFFTH